MVANWFVETQLQTAFSVLLSFFVIFFFSSGSISSDVPELSSKLAGDQVIAHFFLLRNTVCVSCTLELLHVFVSCFPTILQLKIPKISSPTLNFIYFP